VAGLVAVSALGAVATLGFQRAGAAGDPGLAAQFAHATYGSASIGGGTADAGGGLTTLYRTAMIGGFGWVAPISAAAAILSAWFGFRLAPESSHSAKPL
jgi:hypothetical protein